MLSVTENIFVERKPHNLGLKVACTSPEIELDTFDGFELHTIVHLGFPRDQLCDFLLINLVVQHTYFHQCLQI